MNGFLKQCNLVSRLSPEASDDLEALLKTKEFKKGEFINKEGQICKDFFFVDYGLVKHYYYLNGNQYITRFFCENDFFIIMDSFLNYSPAEYTTIALEDTQITYLKNNDLEYLCKKHHSIETFIRKYISFVAFITINRFKSMLNQDATERYNNFLSEYKHILQRISLGDTASYLGMSQVSLSRIRAKK